MSDMTLDGTALNGTGLGGLRIKRSLGLSGYAICFGGIVNRELRKFVNQYERFLSAMVRPVIWLVPLRRRHRRARHLDPAALRHLRALRDLYHAGHRGR